VEDFFWSGTERRAPEIFSKIFCFCGSFSLVYLMKQSDAQRPHPFIRSSVASSGKRLSVLGIPARNEWQEMVLMPGLHISERRSDNVRLNWLMVRFFPEPNLKTGADSS
jgi:hypothetical protein